MPNRRVVVVGGGPGGALAGLVLAQKGFTVDVFDARPEPDPIQQEPARSYALIVNKRGVTALEAAGIDLTPQRQVPFEGVDIQIGQGPAKLVMGRSLGGFEEMTMFEGRAALQHYIIDEARRLADDIDFHFCHSLTRIDIASRTATFITKPQASASFNSISSSSRASAADPGRDNSDGAATAAANEVTFEYDLLVGADGVNSVVRDALAAQVPGFQVDRQDLPSQYKCFHNLPYQQEMMPVEAGKPYSTLVRMCRVQDRLSGGPVTFLVLRRNANRTVSAAISFNSESAAKYKTEADWELALQEVSMPEAARKEAAAQLVRNPWGLGGAWVRCSRLHGPAEVLIGDAAHAVSSSMGEGVNSALEDAVILGQAAQEAGGDPAATAARFTKVRWRAARALVDLDSRQWAAQGLLGTWHPLRFEQLNHRLLRSKLHKWLPGVFEPPKISTITRDAPAYLDILGQMRTDTAITLGTVSAVLVGIALLVQRVRA